MSKMATAVTAQCESRKVRRQPQTPRFAHSTQRNLSTIFSSRSFKDLSVTPPQTPRLYQLSQPFLNRTSALAMSTTRILFPEDNLRRCVRVDGFWSERIALSCPFFSCKQGLPSFPLTPTSSQMHQNSTARWTFHYVPDLCVHCTLRRYKIYISCSATCATRRALSIAVPVTHMGASGLLSLASGGSQGVGLCFKVGTVAISAVGTAALSVARTAASASSNSLDFVYVSRAAPAWLVDLNVLSGTNISVEQGSVLVQECFVTTAFPSAGAARYHNFIQFAVVTMLLPRIGREIRQFDQHNISDKCIQLAFLQQPRNSHEHVIIFIPQLTSTQC